MKQFSTLTLKAVIVLIGLAILALCVFGLPALIMSDNVGYYRPLLIAMYIPAVPFYFGLYQAFKLLNLIDKSKAFSNPAIKTLKYIKISAFIISGFYTLLLPYVYYVAQLDDAPGVMLIGIVIVGASFVVATFAAVMQKLIQNAQDIKEENDLTV
jgi:hypothetical protein